MTLQCPVLSFEGEEHGQVALEPEFFGLPFRLDIISRVIRWQSAKRQAGTHATKTIAYVRGTGKKPYKQKGTGRARQGSLRSPQFRGGAVIFGPQVRSHAHDLPKKIRKLGLKVALSHKIAEKTFHIFQTLEMPQAKLKTLLDSMERQNIQDALFVGHSEGAQNLVKSLGNLRGFDFLPVGGLNVLDVMRKRHMIINLSSMDALKGRLV